jgi:SagB-type dehydrogenase family enzyme
MGIAHDYLDAILRRARQKMEPAGFEPNWDDLPRKNKFYPDLEYLPLPVGPARAGATVQAGLFPPAEDVAAFTLPVLADMLIDSYGQHARRLAIHANSDVDGLPLYDGASWARGTASGGGLYPVSIYWVTGANGPVLPGVYYYSTAHHAMQRLLTGDVSGEVRAAVGDVGLGQGADQFLVLGVKFWQNAFKYNSFSYHAVSMDIGTLVQSWRMWARAIGMRVASVQWFDELRLCRLLGVVPEDEGIFAVVPLPWTGRRAAEHPPAPNRIARPPRVTYAERERSRRVIRFDAVTGVHLAAVKAADDRPAVTALDRAAAHPSCRAGKKVIALPAPQPLDMGVRDALRRRRSSFGRFSATAKVTAGQLSTVLAAATSAAALDCDITATDTGLSITKFFVFVNHIDDIPPGVYELDASASALRELKAGSPAEFLQRNYFLDNYNLEQAGAIIVPTVRAAAVLDAVGDRGYRITNAVIGAVAQGTYVAASALGIGCGVALGFDNISYIEELDLAETGEAPLLIMMIGNERPMSANFRYDIV